MTLSNPHSLSFRQAAGLLAGHLVIHVMTGLLLGVLDAVGYQDVVAAPGVISAMFFGGVAGVVLGVVTAILPLSWQIISAGRTVPLYTLDARIWSPRVRISVWLGGLVLGGTGYLLFLAVARLGAKVTDPGLMARYLAMGSLIGVAGALVFAAVVVVLVQRVFADSCVRRWAPGFPWIWFLGFPGPWVLLAMVVVWSERQPFLPAARVVFPLALVTLAVGCHALTSRLKAWTQILLGGVVLGGMVLVSILTLSGAGFEPKSISGPLSGPVFGALNISPHLHREGQTSRHGRSLGGEASKGSGGEAHLFPSEGPDRVRFPAARRYNVIVLVIDALRADHVHSYGYSRKTTPHLDRLAEEGLLFENAVCQFPSTGISIPSLLSGRYPEYMAWGSPEHKNHYVVLPENTLISDVLRQHGYHTAALVSGWIDKNLNSLSKHFDEWIPLYPHSEWRTYVRNSSPVSTFRAIRYLEKRNRTTPFFLVVHYEEPHEPYINHEAPGKTWGKTARDRYDSDVHWADLWVGILLQYLSWQGWMEDTVIIATSDHGEEFEEHGKKYHGHQLYQESIHVPLIIRVPGGTRHRIAERVALVDLFPTVLDLTGLPSETETHQGMSLWHVAMTDGDPGRDRPVFSMLLDRGQRPVRSTKAVLRGRYKYLSNLTLGSEELYDLEQDPGERIDLVDTAGDALAEMRSLLDEYLLHCDPSWEVF